MKNVNPEMITLGREARGLSQTALAERIGVSQSKISKYENGSLGVAEEDLFALSDALCVSAQFLHQADQVRGPGSPCLHHRKQQSVSISQLRMVHARINILRMQISRLLKDVAIESVHSFDRMDIDLFDGRVQEIAELVRGSWRLPLGPVRNLVAAIEGAGGVVFRSDFGEIRIDAISQWCAGLPPLFFINARRPVDRIRFSLAHECAHIFMHTVPNADQERQADRFASEFLMPAAEIKSEFRSPVSLSSLAAMKPRWRVSIQALAMRAKHLGVISEKRCSSLFRTMSRLGWRKNEPIQLDPEMPTVLPQIIDVHMKDHGRSVDDLSSLANAQPDQFRATFFPEYSMLRIVRP